mgnify:FL=1|tara:strand:+ start:52 stop:504 length:453 start_codon:yes stop_codon:yes gene_type:complete
MKSKTIQNDIINLEAVKKNLDDANNTNAMTVVKFCRFLISEMIKKKKKDLPKLEFDAFDMKILTTINNLEANLIVDALDVYLEQLRKKTFKGTNKPKDKVAQVCSDNLYFRAEKLRKHLHNIVTEYGYEESQAKLHKEADKEIWGDKYEG